MQKLKPFSNKNMFTFLFMEISNQNSQEVIIIVANIVILSYKEKSLGVGVKESNVTKTGSTLNS